MTYTNFQSAFIRELEKVYTYGEEITVRGSITRELLMHSFAVLKPDQRVAIIKYRNGNIFAQIAETLWMLSGRDDMDFLERYIPKCRQWSDDGETWRGAYGPRLREWPGKFSPHPGYNYGYTSDSIDQLKEVAAKLNDDPFTRQAVISLWNPAEDWIKDSKDYPCNNWLHFIAREGKLHLNVAVRSNDIIFGFSHVDFFGWSVLLQMMAYWTNMKVGTITWNVTSFHLYESHWSKAKNILNDPPTKESVYKSYSVPEFSTPIDQLDERLSDIFMLEKAAREGDWDGAKKILTMIFYADDRDEFLSTCAAMLCAYNVYEHGEKTLAANIISALPMIDFRVAAIEFFARKDIEIVNNMTLTEVDIDYIGLTHR